MRINQWLARSTGLSRRAADTAIRNGVVSVNGVIATIGQTVEDSDAIALENQPVKVVPLTYIAFHKPVGYICSRVGQGNGKTVYDLLPLELRDLKTVGRLDKRRPQPVFPHWPGRSLDCHPARGAQPSGTAHV